MYLHTEGRNQQRKWGRGMRDKKEVITEGMRSLRFGRVWGVGGMNLLRLK